MPKSRILIVDDEAIVRESIKDWLTDAGYEVTTTETGEEAQEMMSKQDFGVVILDIRLPGKTGLEVLKEVKALKPGIKSIIITAYPSEETTAEAKKLGAIDYLIKPIAPDELEKVICDTLQKADNEI
ncbi:MAG: response regulator [Dehalococcoidales bacterium]|nr:response regulator [Dehalococcoidales bacterium]